MNYFTVVEDAYVNCRKVSESTLPSRSAFYVPGISMGMTGLQHFPIAEFLGCVRHSSVGL